MDTEIIKFPNQANGSPPKKGTKKSGSQQKSHRCRASNRRLNFAKK